MVFLEQMHLSLLKISAPGSYEKFALAFSVLIFVVLLVVSTFHKVGGYGVETDFYWAYAPDAQRVLHGEMPQEPGVGPIYAGVLAVADLVVGDFFVTGKLLSVIAAVLCGLFSFKLIAELFDARLGFYTMVLWHATVLPWSITAGTDLFFAMLVAASLYCLFRGGSFTNANLAIGGFFTGVTFLTRPNAVVLPIGVVVILLLLNPDGATLPRRLKSLTLFASVFVAVNLPWNLLQYFSAGTPVRSDSYLIIASHFYGKPGVVSSEDMRLAAQKFDSLRSVIFYDFGHFVKHYLSNLYHHLHQVLIQSVKFPSFLFAGAGALLLAPKLNRRQLALFVFPALSFLLLCLVHYEPRYYLYILSFFLLFVPYFFFSGKKEKGHSGQLAIYLRAVVFAGTIGSILMTSVREVRKNISEEPREIVQVAGELRDKIEPNSAIIARKPHLGFLVNMKTVYFPETGSLRSLLELAAAEQAKYLLYGQVESERRPDFRILLEPDKTPPEFEAICQLDQPRTVVYRLRI